MVAPTNRKQDKFQSYYTNCDHITSYMVGLLECDNNMSVLEPCAGEGVFIDELSKQELTPEITAYELNIDAVNQLNIKYNDLKNIEIIHQDFILANTNKKFDRVIANPPYGAYQSPEKRKQLKKAYPHIYAKETYGLFLIQTLELLKQDGRLVFIIPDTYLSLHHHQGLRKEIISNYKIESITLFPSDFFPGVNFGYAGLSIISIVKEKPNIDYNFPVYKGLHSPSELTELLTKTKKNYEVCRLSYHQLINNPSQAFFLSSKDWISQILSSDNMTVGDICFVVTGFYSGNDGKYLRRSPSVTRGTKKYAIVENNKICRDNLSINPPLNGIKNDCYWVPIVKGGNQRFYKQSEWFMDWGEKAVHDYKVTNKQKARFQNSQFYFRQGIAVPMISSSSITGSLLDGRLFDQSIVGIFPRQDYQDLIYYLLGFFNSKACNDLIRIINISTNNSANYIKKIPLIIPQKPLLEKISKEVEKLVILSKYNSINDQDLQELNQYFYEVYGAKISE